MKKYIILSILCVTTLLTHAQDSAFTYIRIIKLDSLNKNEIFDKTLIWCSKSFNDSKSAINVRERESGIIAGKAYYNSDYKIPKGKDSILMSKKAIQYFVHYHFDWLIEIKDQKLRFSISNIKLAESDKEYDLATTKPPYGFLDQSTSKTSLHWMLSKRALPNNLDRLLATLESEIRLKKSDW